mgnify:FL=1
MRFNLATILRWAVYAAAFIPLVIFSQYISPFHFGKVVVFRSLVELMLPLYLLLIWQDRSYMPRMSPVSWGILSFALAFTLATITSVESFFSFWGTLERMGGLFTFWHYVVFYFIMTSVLKTPEHWRRFIDCVLVAGVLSAIYGFGQKTDIGFFVGSGGRERIFGTIGNAALFAGYEIVISFLALTCLVQERLPGRKRFLQVVSVLGILAVIMTVVRGSLMGLGIGLTVFAVLHWLKFRTKTGKRTLIVLGSAAIILLIFVLTPLQNSGLVKNSRFLSRLTDTSFNTFTVKTRFWTWQSGLEGWKENPKTVLVGWGPEDFNVPFSKHFNPNIYTGPGSETFFDRAHNMFVEVLVTMGVVGLAAYVSIFVAIGITLWRLWKSGDEYSTYAIGLASLFIAYIIHNSFIFDTSANFIAFFSVAGFVSFLYLRNQPLPLNTRRNAGGLSKVLALAGVMAAVILVYSVNVVPAKANYSTTRAILLGWANDFSGAIAKFKESVAYDVPGKYEYRHRLAQFLLEYTNNSKPVTPEVKEVILFTINEVKKNISESGQDYLPHLYASRLYVTLGKDDPNSPYNDLALEQAQAALNISPNFVRTQYEFAQVYLNRKDYARAVEYFKKAVELNPRVGVSYWYLGFTEKERGNYAESAKIVEKAFENGYAPSKNDFGFLVELYSRLNDKPKIVRTYEWLVVAEPKNAQFFASLAAAYAQVGRIDDALNAARKAVVIDPAFIKEAQAFARSLGREL